MGVGGHSLYWLLRRDTSALEAIYWWKNSGFSHIDVEIANIQDEIARIEQADSISHDPWHLSWLRALHNRHNTLLWQQISFGGRELKFSG